MTKTRRTGRSGGALGGGDNDNRDGTEGMGEGGKKEEGGETDLVLGVLYEIGTGRGFPIAEQAKLQSDEI